MSSDKLLNQETIDMLFETLEDDFYDVINEFLSVGSNLSKQIQQIGKNTPVNTEELICAIHTLKGASGNIGGEHLANLCMKFEADLRNNITDNLDTRINQIADCCTHTCNIFRDKFKKAS